MPLSLLSHSQRSRLTVFTEKLGAYLVYSPLKPGQPSDFALRLTDLDEETPIANADVTLNLRSKSNQTATVFKAQASETTGVYTSHVAAPKAGEYYAEFQISHPKFSGRLRTQAGLRSVDRRGVRNWCKENESSNQAAMWSPPGIDVPQL
jgi:hypothetical protein